MDDQPRSKYFLVLQVSTSQPATPDSAVVSHMTPMVGSQEVDQMQWMAEDIGLKTAAENLQDEGLQDQLLDDVLDFQVGSHNQGRPSLCS